VQKVKTAECSRPRHTLSRTHRPAHCSTALGAKDERSGHCRVVTGQTGVCAGDPWQGGRPSSGQDHNGNRRKAWYCLCLLVCHVAQHGDSMTVMEGKPCGFVRVVALFVVCFLPSFSVHAFFLYCLFVPSPPFWPFLSRRLRSFPSSLPTQERLAYRARLLRVFSSTNHRPGPSSRSQSRASSQVFSRWHTTNNSTTSKMTTTTINDCGESSMAIRRKLARLEMHATCGCCDCLHAALSTDCCAVVFIVVVVVVVVVVTYCKLTYCTP